MNLNYSKFLGRITARKIRDLKFCPKSLHDTWYSFTCTKLSMCFESIVLWHILMFFHVPLCALCQWPNTFTFLAVHPLSSVHFLSNTVFEPILKTKLSLPNDIEKLQDFHVLTSSGTISFTWIFFWPPCSWKKKGWFNICTWFRTIYESYCRKLHVSKTSGTIANLWFN